TDMAGRILKAYIKDKNLSKEELAKSFTDIIGYACVESAYNGKWKPWTGRGDGLSTVLKEDSRLMRWIVNRIDAIRSEGGAQ
ncbi:MAG: hypothetical protein J6N76_01140, partial [Lachnospiraceae bacterium]|nr:hypothetical protein [Lachnospiraceae bacterium]